MVSVSLRMPNSTAPVSWKMAKLPPIISRKQMSSAPSRKPLMGAARTISGPSITLGTSRKVPATVTLRVPSLVSIFTRWYSPEGITHDSASTTITRAITTTRV